MAKNKNFLTVANQPVRSMAKEENEKKYISTSTLIELLEKNMRQDKNLLTRLQYL